MRSGTCLFVALLAVFCSCGSGQSPFDGYYTGTGTGTLTGSGAGGTETTTGFQVQVVSANESNQIGVILPGTAPIYFATLSGSDFTFEEATRTSSGGPGSVSDTFAITGGSGSFGSNGCSPLSPKSLCLSFTVNTTSGQMLPDGGFVMSGESQDAFSFLGTKD